MPFSLAAPRSVPLSPSSDNVLGFQLDLLMGAVNGEVKMKITSYDRSEGQVEPSISHVCHEPYLSVSSCLNIPPCRMNCSSPKSAHEIVLPLADT